MKMIDHNHFICHLILGTFTEYPYLIANYVLAFGRIIYKGERFLFGCRI